MLSQFPKLLYLGLSIPDTPMLWYSDTPTFRTIYPRHRDTPVTVTQVQKTASFELSSPSLSGGKVRRCGHKRHTLQSKVNLHFIARATVLHRYIPALVGCVFPSDSGNETGCSCSSWFSTIVTGCLRHLSSRLSLTRTSVSQFSGWCNRETLVYATEIIW